MPYTKDKHSTDKFGYKTTTTKKQGYGCYSWGKIDDTEISPAAIDKNDPNYEDEEEKNE